MALFSGSDIDMRRFFVPAFRMLKLTFRLLVLCHFALARRESLTNGRLGKDFLHHHHPSRMLSSTTPLMQAWRTECKKDQSCHMHPAIPKKGYLISMPGAEDQAKRDFSLKQLGSLGLELEVVDGRNSTHYAGSPDVFTRCMPAGDAIDCQLGLTLTHMAIWRSIAAGGEQAAWVFEDDLVVHDSLVQLLPQYWRQVPKSFEYVAVGQIPRAFGVAEQIVTAGPEKMPWGTHAYIITADLAERMVRLADFMLERSRKPTPVSTGPDGAPHWFHTTSWTLDGEDIKIDHFLNMVYEQLTPRGDAHKWIVFESTAAVPFQFHGVEWSRHGGCECNCADADAIEQCVEHGRAPAYGTGLFAQHRCARKVDLLEKWGDKLQAGIVSKSLQVCSERTACGEYLCDGDKPLADPRPLVSPISTWVNDKLQGDPNFLAEASATKSDHVPTVAEGASDTAGSSIELQQATAPESAAADEALT